jgi:type VI secretion system protein VasD
VTTTGDSGAAGRPALVLTVLVIGACGCVSACAKAPPPAPPLAPASITIAAPPDTKVKASLNIVASADVNPDGSGRASPVVVRVYQLKTDALFTSADYFALFGDDQKALGQELISRDEFTLEPSERQTLDIVIAGDTRFVGVFAAYRDSRNTQWRAVVPAPRRGLSVAVERARIVLRPAE